LKRTCGHAGCGRAIKDTNKSGFCTTHYQGSPHWWAVQTADGRTCPECGKPIRKVNLYGYCNKHKYKSERWRAGLPARRARNRLNQASRYLQKTYGITLEQKMERLKEQGGKCAICGQIESAGRGWAMDHCHATGKLRGILCHHCNVGIGALGDDPSRLQAAIEYLREHT
jgi:hypothetical protein